MPPGTSAGRPIVLILGGGFAGIGAARKLKDADVDVVLVDKHNYPHLPAAPLPGRDRPARDVGRRPSAARPLPRPAERRRPSGHRDRDRSRRSSRSQFDEMAPIAYDYLVLGARRRASTSSAPKGAAEHAFPMYTLADAVRLREQVLEKWEAADRNPELIEDGALNVVVVGGGATGIESVGAMAELYRIELRRRTTRRPAAGQGATDPRRGRPGALHDVQVGHPHVHEAGAREARRRGAAAGSRPPITPTRVTLKSGHGAQGAHARVGRRHAGEPDRPVARARAPAAETAYRSGRTSASPDHPEVFVVGDIAWITDKKTDEMLPQLGSVALQSGECAGENIARLVGRQEDRAVRLQRQGDDGDDRPRRRGRAVQAAAGR